MKIIVLISILFALVIIAGCTQTTTISPDTTLGSVADSVTTTISPDTTTTTLENNTPLQSIREFTMTAKQWEFTPSEITVNEGDLVKLHITSIDVSHGFRLTPFGIDERLEPGTTVDIEFIADKSGYHSFFCDVFCGSGHSTMTGTLIVNPAE